MSKKVAQELLNINAVHLKPNDMFTWTSGIKSPIYTDIRLTIHYPKVRDLIASELVEYINNKYKDVDQIAGISTGGIPHAAFIAQKMNKPMAYIRSESKQHGLNKQYEGVVKEGMKIIVVEDLMSTGKTSTKVVKDMQDMGIEVLEVVGVFNYGFNTLKEKFDNLNVPFSTLTNYFDLVDEAIEKKFVKEEDLDILKKWHKEIDNKK